MRAGPGQQLLETVPARRWAVTMLGASLVLVTVLAVLVAHQATADGFDRAVDSPVIAWLGGQRGVLAWLAFPGTPPPAAVVTLVLVVACLRVRRLNGAILALAAVPVSTGLDEALIKPLVHRTYLGALAFPSGHTTTVTALAATVVVLYSGRPGPAEGTRPENRRRPTTMLKASGLAVMLAAICVVALAVIGLRWHYFTDTVAGAAIGAGTVCAVALILDSPFARRVLTPRRYGGPNW